MRSVFGLFGYIGRWPGMVYPPHPRVNFVDHIFLKAYYLDSILQHESYLVMGSLPSNTLLHSLPLQKVKFHKKLLNL